jgi:V/A-type H+-transporting ATPase subunit A
MTDTAETRVTAVQAGVVRFRLRKGAGGALIKNAVVHVLHARAQGQRLKAEILRIDGDSADAQVLESTAGVAFGDAGALTGRLLSVHLGPGLLGAPWSFTATP